MQQNHPVQSSFSVLPLRLAPRKIISCSVCWKCHPQVFKDAERSFCTLCRLRESGSIQRTAGRVANYENQKMGVYCITRLLTWAVLLHKNTNLKTLDPSPPTNPNLPLRKLCPVLGICHTPIIKAVDTVWSLDQQLQEFFRENQAVGIHTSLCPPTPALLLLQFI